MKTPTQRHSMWLFVATTTAAIVLIVAGFVVPPTGVIDPSVLTAVGELFAFATLAQLPAMLESGHKVKVQKGDTTIELHDTTPNLTDNDNNDTATAGGK